MASLLVKVGASTLGQGMSFKSLCFITNMTWGLVLTTPFPEGHTFHFGHLNYIADNTSELRLHNEPLGRLPH